MQFIGNALMSAGTISLLLGGIGVNFCGFAISFKRGLRNLIIPFVAFGDAMRHFPILIWMEGGGIATIILGSLFI